MPPGHDESHSPPLSTGKMVAGHVEVRAQLFQLQLKQSLARGPLHVKQFEATPFLMGGTCVVECPANHAPDAFDVCHECHETCGGACTGPGATTYFW